MACAPSHVAPQKSKVKSSATTSAGSTTSVYVYKHFSDQSHRHFGTDPTSEVRGKHNSTGLDFAGGSTGYDAKGNASTWSGNKDYNVARTPYIQSQLVAGATVSYTHLTLPTILLV